MDRQNSPSASNEVNPYESEELLKKFYSMIQDNHDLQCRFRWRNPHDIAIWDNRSVFHRATFDYMDLGERSGNRAVGIGEILYFDPESKSKAEALGKEKPVKSNGAANGAINGNSSCGHRMAAEGHGAAKGGCSGGGGSGMAMASHGNAMAQ
ncbi:hypothetical protein QBC42DRAFT_252593 [Cladorrhinum samala]|uniref:TauD/TfdA-like domain-containing protein n=1 Tax=Cladorrhinum samala TaxID=585594 RepID=A0AAV9HPF3_9PEZI|nr:hypothetical protein QBC42DRAFT_252593 [Cladorrhinum samala]